MELIDRLTEDEVPVDELDEAYGIEEIVYCCRTIPCSSPTECPR